MQISSLRYKKSHVSVFVGWAATGVLIGVVLSIMGDAYFVGWGWLVLLCAILIIIARIGYTWLLAVALFVGMGIGVWRGDIEQADISSYQRFVGSDVMLEGVVSNDPEYGDRGDQRFRVNRVSINGQQLPGTIYVGTFSIIDIKRSDKVVLSGSLREGFGNFQAQMYYAQIVEASRSKPGDVARQVRDWFAAGIRNAVAEPEASLGVGYLVGQRSALPDTLDEQLRVVGLTHVVVASGYNLTILVRFARRSLENHSKYLSMIFASSMISGFVLITGFSPSMSRAALVTGLSLAAWYYGRRVHPLLLLIFAAAITVLINPLYIWGDIGWYLSFTAFGGVVLLAPLVRQYLFGQSGTEGAIRQVLVETTSAQLATMPIIMFIFGTYSLLALPANLLVLPLVPLAMLLSFVAGVAGVVAPQFAGWFGVPANALLGYMTNIVEFLASLSWAEGNVQIGIIGLIASYIALMGLGYILLRKTKHNYRRDNIIE